MIDVSDLIGATPPVANLVKETSTQAFMADVIDASMEVPVIVDFWAPWCGPCKQLGPMLEKAVNAAKGAVKMVKLNIDDHPEIPTQMRVQSIPAVYAFKDGRPVDGFVGAVPESQIKEFIKRLVALGGGSAGPSPLEEALEVAKQAMTDRDLATAQNIYQQVVQHQPDNVVALLGLTRIALAESDIEAAKAILAQIPADQDKAAEVVSARTALELAEQAAAAAEGTAGFEQRLVRDPADHEARLELAVALFGNHQREAAIDHLLYIVKADREWNDQAGRKQLVKFFEALGPMDPLTVQTRKRLSSILFA